MNVVNQQRPSDETFTQFRNGPSISSGGVGATVPVNGAPPPLPPRVSHQIRNYQPYTGMGYGGTPGGYGFGSTWNYRAPGAGGYSPYGAYGGYSQMYPSGFQASGYPAQMGGPSGDVEDRFIQFAEESSRSAFQSIESVVRTFSSVAMMLESTHFAMTSSFRAILSVAENIGRTRNMFGELMSAFALVRFFKWLYKKITFTLGLNPDDPSIEGVWRKTAVEAINSDASGPSTWPILIFLSLSIAIPCIVSKLMNNVKRTRADAGDDPREWFRHKEPVYSALVLYDFEPVNKHELRVKSGQKVWLAPQSLQPKDLPGWSRASDNRGGVGLIPINYTRIVGQLGKKSDEINDARAPTPSSPRTIHSSDSSLSSGVVPEASKETNQRLLDEDTVP